MNLRPLVVTGPIGSGKSTVSKLLEGFGALRVDLDLLSRDVLESPEGVSFVSSLWPATVDESGIDRGQLARRVFNNPSELERLEGFVHPRTIELFQNRYGGEAGLVVEVSVASVVTVFEGFTVVIDSLIDDRISRLIERGMQLTDIRSRMASQPPREEWLALADSIVANGNRVEDVAISARALWNWWTVEFLNPAPGGDE